MEMIKCCGIESLFSASRIESILISTMHNTFEMVSAACETNLIKELHSIKNANFIKKIWSC